MTDEQDSYMADQNTDTQTEEADVTPESRVEPLLDRDRPERRPIVPHWVPITILIGFALLVLGSGVAAWAIVDSRVEVPDLLELDEGLAQVKLSELGLEAATTERRFDDTPEGTVLAQDPAPGTIAHSGDTVGLVVSAGTDTLEMPDVVGQNVRVARARLESEGLIVKVDARESTLPKDTVISSNPAPGATVRTGEIVRVTIAAEGSATDALLPYAMTGATIVIDPGLVPEGSSDVTLDVTRRLQSLLEASGAKVVTTRSAADTSSAESDRAAKVPPTGMTAIVGLDLATSGEGMAVRTLSEDAAADTYQTSSELGDEIYSAIQTAGFACKRGETDTDLILSSSASAGARVTLGSTSSDDDLSLFRDPVWADSVARAIYQGLGERFGSK